VNRQRQFAEFLSGFIVQVTTLELPFDPAKAFAQGDVLIRIAKFEEQLLHFFDALARVSDNPKRRGSLGLPGLYAFKQQALKLAAIFGAIRIDVATAAIEAGAGLHKFTIYDLRFTIGCEFEAEFP
jgi:hypothetical protein